jgi:phospholipid-binding lipoprotein MlaA|tara:strand:+ start:5368 stop:6072 length:705 start_codon:yes stop_codon:yes gene_type:complete
MKKLIPFLLFAFFIIAEEEKNVDADPFEDINRVVFNVSDSLDEVLLKPTAQIYSEYTPLFLKDSVTNFFYNIAEIDTVINQLLQGKPKLAAQDSLRFLINTTIGIGGIFDIATRMGLSRHDEDFGQTLGYWGVPAGSYVFVPFVGPSTVRDLFGIPLSWYVSGSFAIEDEKTKIVFSSLDVIETRERILAAENLIVGDKYEFVKDVFLQSREHSVQDGEVEDEFLSEFEDELFD